MVLSLPFSFFSFTGFKEMKDHWGKSVACIPSLSAGNLFSACI